MLKRIGKRCISLLLAVVMAAGLLPAAVLSASAATAEVATGLTANGDFVEVDGGIKFQVDVTKKSGCSSTSYEDTTGTLILTNTKGKAGNLSFRYAVVSSGGTVTVDGATKTGQGTFTKTLEAGAAISITVNSGSNSGNYGSITLTDISLAVDEVITTTFQPAENGSYTVDGGTIDHPHIHQKNAQEATALSASPAEGYRFYGWYSETEQAYLNKSAEWTVNLTKEQTITAKFVPADSPVFKVDEAVFVDLNDAVAYAQKNNQANIILIEDGRLPAGDYVIPSGKTLLIPYNDVYTVCTTEPVWHANDSSSSASKAYKTLTMAAGANITVQNGGAISVASRAQNTTPNAGVVLGPWGMIKMESESSITMESGASLYCYGFITGQGSVLVKNGAKVYESFQVPSFRGGNASASMNGGSKNKVFPFTQFYIQNVEVPMTLEAGATETVCIGVSMSIVGLQKGSGVLIGKDSGLFKLSSGTVTKRYDGETDRLVIEVNGTADISQMIVNMGSAGNIDSTKFVVPITNNMSVHVNTRSSLNIQYDMAMLPGSQIRVDDGASLGLASGKNLYVYDCDEWIGKGYATNNTTSDFVQLTNAPGKLHKRTTKDLVDAELDINGVMTVNGYLYTTSGGANITSSKGTGRLIQNAAPGTATATYQVTQSGNSATAQSVAITAAQLKNAETDQEGAHFAYTQTSGAAAGNTFVFQDQTWDNQTQSELVSDNLYAPHIPEDFGEVKDATCAEEGLSTGKRCTVCGKVLKAQALTDKVDHIYDTVTWGKWIDPTEEGGCPSITATLSCSVCGEETEGHTVEAEDIKITADTAAASCIKGGTITYTASITIGDETVTCDVKKMVPTETLGHDWDKGKVIKEATCTENGVKTFTCQREDCSEVKTETIEALGHDITKHEAKAATCTQIGWKAYETCSRCDHSTYEEIEALGHDTIEHEAKAATCTEDGWKAYETCSRCEYSTYEEIEALGHNYRVEWGSWAEAKDGWTITAALTCSRNAEHTVPANVEVTSKIAKEATCGEKGTMIYTATVTLDGEELASTTKTVEIPMIPHQWGTWETTKKATCTEKGEETCECENCDKAETRETEATGHQHTTAVSAAAATCRTKGNIAYWICSDCGMKFKDSACTQEVTDVSTALDPNHHEGETEIQGIRAATCSQNGYTGDTYCLACNEKIEDGETIDKLEHTPGKAVQENVVGATCTLAGHYDNVVYCSVCSEELIRETVTGQTLNHTWDEGKVTRNATCTVTGEKTFTCTVCKTASRTESVPVDPSNHVHTEIISAVAPTCTSTGWTAETKCAACDTVIEAQKVVPATGHSWNSGAVSTPAACMVDGVRTFTCDTCGETKTQSIPATGHSMTFTAAKDPTCAEPGNPQYWICNDCGKHFRDSNGENPMTNNELVIPATDIHTEVTTQENQTAAACTENGHYTEVVICSVCHAEIRRENKIIPAAGHTAVTDPAKPSTCTEAGLTEGNHCSVCHTVLKAQESIQATGHNMVSHTAKDPTCIEAGWEAYKTCSRCNYSTGKVERHATGIHTYGEPAWSWTGSNEAGYTVTATFTCSVCHQETGPIDAIISTEYHAPTCIEDGQSTTYTATVNSPDGSSHTDTRGGEKIDANGHTYVVTWSWGSTQETEESGYTATATAIFECSACHDKVTISVEAAVVRIDPTCTEKGSITYTAAVNGQDGLQAEGEKVEELPALGHDYKDIGSPATCTESGCSKMQCSHCDDIQDNGEIPAAGHKWDSWTATKAATCEAEGERCHTCTVCGAPEYKVIGKLGHTEMTDPAKPSTCTETGLTEGSHCSVCGTVIIPQTETTKAPHSYGQPEIIWAQNDEGGWSANANFTCTVCSDAYTVWTPNNLTHKEAPAATCTAAGNRMFTAEFHGVNGETYTGTHSMEIAPLGHDLVQHEAQAPTCTENGWAAYETCSRCDHSTKGETATATGHNYEIQWIWTGEGNSTGATLNLVCQNDQTHASSVQAKVKSETTPATTQAAGKTVYTASAEYDGVEYADVKEVEIARLPTRPSGGGGSYTPPSNPGEIEITGPDTPLGGTPDKVTVTIADAPSGSGNKTIIVKQGSTVLDKVPGGVTAAIPVESASSGMVAVLVGADGAETVIRKSVVSGSTLIVPVEGTSNISIRDNTKQFTDVAGSAWYAPAVAFVSSHELFSGVSATTFAPTTTMSRAMLAQVLHNLENNPAAVAKADFSDVASGIWYEAAVAWASENQIVTGYTDGRFGSNDNISRQDMVVMLWRYANKPSAKNTALSFNDAGKVSGYAREAMLWAVENGIINGKGNNMLDPLGSATRAEVAKVIQNYLLYLVK